MKQLKQWISIKWNKNTYRLILIGIVLINILLWLFASLLASWIAPVEYGNIVNTLWTSGLDWMLGGYDSSLPLSIRIISIVVVLTSMVTFTGGIIGYLSSLFTEIIDSTKTGRNNLFIYDHILILNWNNKALELIADYQHDDDATTIVVLSSQPKSEIEDAINRKLFEHEHETKKHKNINVIVREGEVFSKSDLCSVCIEKARSIIILSDESLDNDASSNDILSIKTLMLVSNLNLRPEQTIIIEVKSNKALNLITNHIAKHAKMLDQIITILPDELMGRLIAQTVLMEGLNKVYGDLLSFEGAEFNVAAKQDMQSYLETHSRAIPIYTYQEQLYVLSESEEDVDSLRSSPLTQYIPLKPNVTSPYSEIDLVIFGKNNKLNYILDSIRCYETENNAKVNVTLIKSNDVNIITESLGKLAKIDKILILSADFLDHHQYDSDVLVTLLSIQDAAERFKAEIIIELLDPKHLDIMQSYNIKNTIISSQYISTLITQISKNRYLYPVIMQLLSYETIGSPKSGEELESYPAHELFDMPFPLNFKSASEFVYSVFRSFKGEYVILGLIKNDILEIFLGNLDQPRELIIEANDIVITVTR